MSQQNKETSSLSLPKNKSDESLSEGGNDPLKSKTNLRLVITHHDDDDLSSTGTSPTTLSELSQNAKKRKLKRMRSPLGAEDEIWVASKPYIDEVLSPELPDDATTLQSTEKPILRVGKIKTLVYKDSSYYEGELKNTSTKHGKGTLHYHNGDMYDGEYCEDVRHGSGTCKFVNSVILAFTGNWQNDKPVEGKDAVVLYRNGDRYFGQVRAEASTLDAFFLRNLADSPTPSSPLVDTTSVVRVAISPSMLPHIQKHGRGELHCSNGTKYFGNFSSDHMSGYGVKVFKADNVAEERQYYGKFKDSQPDGYGVMIYKDGTVFEGEWKAGNKHGKGTLSLANGDKIEGSWQNDLIKNASYKKGTIAQSSRCSKILLRENVHEMEKRVDVNKMHFSHINYCSIPASELMSKHKYRDFFTVYASEIKLEQKKFTRSSTNLFIQDRKKTVTENAEPLSPISRKSIQDSIQIYLDEALLSKRVASHYQTELDGSDEEIDTNSNVLSKIIRDFVHLFNWRYHHSFINTISDAKLQLPNALDDLYAFFSEFKNCVCDVLGVDAVAIYGAHKLMYIIKNTVTKRVYQTLFAIYKLCYEEQDMMYKFKLLSLCKIEMKELGVKDDFIPDLATNKLFNRPYTDCIRRLLRLSTHCQTAHEKFNQLVEVHQEIVNAIDYNVMSKKCKMKPAMDIGADDVFPVYLYVFIRAQLPNLYSEYQFMSDFMDEHVRITEASYRFTGFENAMNFVHALDVNIRDDRGVLVPMSQIENQLERAILDISTQIRRDKKEMPRFLWMSSLFIVMGNYAATEMSKSITSPTPVKSTDRKLILDGNHHHVYMLEKYFEYAKPILRCLGVDVLRYESSISTSSSSSESTPSNEIEEIYNRQSVEWTNLPQARHLRKMMNPNTAVPDSPSNLLPRVGSVEDLPQNPMFEIVFNRMYPSYVYFSLAKNVEKITDYVIHVS